MKVSKRGFLKSITGALLATSTIVVNQSAASGSERSTRTKRSLIGGFGSNTFCFINFMKGFSRQSFGNALPSELNDDGYPRKALTGEIFGYIPLPAGYTGDWVVKWTGALAFSIEGATNITAGDHFVSRARTAGDETHFSEIGRAHV